MKNDTKSKTGNPTKTATAALADINAQIAELHQKRIGLAEPLKTRYSELRKELADMVTEIKNLDGDWSPEPMKPKTVWLRPEPCGRCGFPQIVLNTLKTKGN